MQAHCYRGRYARLPAGTGNSIHLLINNLAALDAYAVLDLNGVIGVINMTATSHVGCELAAALYG
jgi:hypothetical protein